MEPRVAVIIPCHEDGPLAVEAVESVRESEPVEIVVVDDGSTAERTRRALEALGSGAVTVIHRQHAGISSARMSGVAASSAPYLYPLDADDLLLPGSLGRLADALDGAPACGFAFGDFEIFGEYRGIFRAPRRFDPWALTYANFIPSGSLIRRDAIDAVGGWDFESGMEDWDLWLKLAGAGWDAVRAPGTVYRKRVTGSGMQAHGRRNQRRFYRLLRERHRRLFASRTDLARASRSSRGARLLYPPLFGLRNLGLVPPRIEAPIYRLMVSRPTAKLG